MVIIVVRAHQNLSVALQVVGQDVGVEIIVSMLNLMLLLDVKTDLSVHL